MTTCPSCATELELDAAFCGQCGARVRARRRTLVGAELDGRFRVDAKLAEGGFGSIYRATHLGSRHVVALKVLHAELAADPHLAARFRREGATLAALRSPHTVTVYEVGETADGTLFIAMELLSGESLLDRFRARGALAWREVLAITKSVCRSLGEAHALGIVHRDLKPGNIHLAANDHVKVLDFGIAKLLRGSDSDDGDDLTRVGQAVGTLEYMAPEQLIGAACDGRSDIYGLGVVIYEMITGRRPYADATGPTSLVAAVMTQPLIPPSSLVDDVPAAVDALVLRCLARDPKDRFATVGDLIAAIDAIEVPLARGSWSTEIAADDEATWIDAVPPALPPVMVTPRSHPVQHADAGVAYEPTHMQYAVAPITNPGVGTAERGPATPARGLARGSASPFGRARRESDAEEVQAEASPQLPVGRAKRGTPPRHGGPLVPATFRAPTPPFAVADGSRDHVAPFAEPTRPAQVYDAPPTGSVPLVELAPDAPAARPSVLPEGGGVQVARPLGVVRVALWTVGLFAGGTGLGMLVASLIG